MAQEPDPVAALLTRSPLSNAQRADLWDAYQNAPDPDALTTAIQALTAPDHVKAQLWDLKSAAPSGDDAAFRSWYAEQAKTLGLNPDPATQQYDYRAAFKAGLTADASGHWPSVLKPDDHPNLVVGGFNTKTGERVPGQPQASEAELVRLGWDPTTAKRLSQSGRTWGDTAVDVGKGVLKGAGNTAFGLGKLVHDYTPIGRIGDAIQTGAFAQRPPELEPTNTPQKVGFGAEQIGEFFLPTGLAGKVGKAAEVAKAAGVTLAQTGSPGAAGVSGALTAVIPGAGAVKRVAGALETSAQKSMAQALGAAKEWAKSDAAKLAPEMLKRGIGGSRPAMLEHAEAVAARVGADLNAAYKAATAAGETVPGLVVRGNVQLASDALHVLTPAGKRIPLPGYETAIAQLSKLDEFIGQLGDDIPVDKGAFVKRAWDDIVSTAGLYGQKATASASEKAMAWSFREAANSFRSLLNTNPTIAALNKEAGFWIGLRDVLDATKLRTQAQGYGLIQAGGSMVGATVGATSGEGVMDSALKGAMGLLAGQQFIRLLQSPTWRSKVSGPLKHQLADALASGSAGRIADVAKRITASVPAQFRPALAQ